MRLNHVTLTVTDLETAIRFYERLGLNLIVLERPRYARFECPDGDTTLSLEGLGADSELPAQATSIHFECDRLDERVAELERAGIEFEQPPTDQPWLWRDATLRDPDGNRIHLFSAGESRLNPPWRLAGS